MNWRNTIETATETSQILAHRKPRRSGSWFSSVIARSRSRRSLRRSRRTADRASETDDLTLPITGSAFAIRQTLPRAGRQIRQVALLRLHQIHHEDGLFTIDLQAPPIRALANHSLQAIVSVFQLGRLSMSASPEAIVTRMTSPDDAPASSMPAIDTCAGLASQPRSAIIFPTPSPTIYSIPGKLCD